MSVFWVHLCPSLLFSIDSILSICLSWVCKSVLMFTVCLSDKDDQWNLRSVCEGKALEVNPPCFFLHESPYKHLVHCYAQLSTWEKEPFSTQLSSYLGMHVESAFTDAWSVCMKAPNSGNRTFTISCRIFPTYMKLTLATETFKLCIINL